jgi:hypothetical protein
MWPQITQYLPQFPSAVLSGLDQTGYPFSLRCQPVPDSASQVLRVQLPSGITLQAGAACLLWHTHDERLWNLKSFVVRGVLEHEANGWVLRPLQFVPGIGIGGWRSYVNFVLHGRAATRAYFAKRGLARPRVHWDELLNLLGA